MAITLQWWARVRAGFRAATAQLGQEMNFRTPWSDPRMDSAALRRLRAAFDSETYRHEMAAVIEGG